MEIKNSTKSHTDHIKEQTIYQDYHFFLPIILQKIGYVCSYVLFRFFVKIEIRGREHLTHFDADISRGHIEPLIIAANHTSELDSLVLPLIFPFFSTYVLRFLPLYFVANPKEKYRSFGWRKYIYGGFFFQILGAYPVHSGRRDYEYALAHHIELLRRRKTMCIFPEGRRTQDGSLSPARGGVAYLAYVSGASVLPVAIDTFFALSWPDFLLRRRKVVVTIGKIVHSQEIVAVSEPTVEDFRNGGKLIMSRIQDIMKNGNIEKAL